MRNFLSCIFEAERLNSWFIIVLTSSHVTNITIEKNIYREFLYLNSIHKFYMKLLLRVEREL